MAATKKIRLPISIGIADPDRSKPEIKDKDGRLVEPAVTHLKHVDPGHLVELDAVEADRLLAKFGPYTETVVVSDGQPEPVAPPAPAQAVPPAAAPQSIRRP